MLSAFSLGTFIHTFTILVINAAVHSAIPQTLFIISIYFTFEFLPKNRNSYNYVSFMIFFLNKIFIFLVHMEKKGKSIHT